MSGFIWAAAGLTVLILWPVLHRARESQSDLRTAGIGILLIVLVAVAGYWNAGEPRALDPQAAVAEPQVPDVDSMMSQLEQRLADQPDDLEGWSMLARSYMVLGRYPEARDVYARLLAMPGGDQLENRLALAEASVLVDPAALDGAAGALFEETLAADPGNARALWYGGIAAWRRGDEDLGKQRWGRLLDQGPPEEIAAIIRERIGMAAPVSSAPDSTTQPAASGVTIAVRVSIAPELAASVSAGDVLFIYARHPNGGPPMAIRRLTGADLPIEIQLGAGDDLMGQGGGLLPPMQIVARLSATGTAMPQSGDRSGRVSLDAMPSGVVEVVIDQVVP